MDGKKNKIICFSTTHSMYDALLAIAPSRDSMSALLREIIKAYLASQQPPPSEPKQ